MKWRNAIPLFLIVLVCADIVSAVEQSMMFAAFKAIVEDTGDPIEAGWLISAYYVVAGPAAVVAGRLGDMYGRRKILLATLLLVLAGSVLSSLSSYMLGIIVGRGLQGVSSAILPLCIAIYRENTKAEKLGVGLGILISAHAFGTLIGLVLGGMIVDMHHWSSIFVAAAAFALIALLLVYAFIPNLPRSAPERIDWLGLGIAPVAIFLLFGISALNSPILSVPQAVSIIVVSLVLLGVWGWHELRCEKPIVDLRAFRDKRILLANLTAFFTALGPNNVTLYFTTLLQQPRWTGTGFGLSASASGLWTAPSSLVSAGAAPIAGYMTGRFGPRTVLIGGALIQIVGWVLALLFHQIFWPLMIIMLLCVTGAMVTHVGVISTVTAASPEAHTGEALGAVTVVRSIGSAIGSQLIALMLSLSVVTSAAHPAKRFPDMLAHMLTLSTVLLFATVAFVVAIMSRQRHGGEDVAIGGSSTVIGH